MRHNRALRDRDKEQIWRAFNPCKDGRRGPDSHCDAPEAMTSDWEDLGGGDNDKSPGAGQILNREGLGAERRVSGSVPSADPFQKLCKGDPSEESALTPRPSSSYRHKLRPWLSCTHCPLLHLIPHLCPRLGLLHPALTSPRASLAQYQA